MAGGLFSRAGLPSSRHSCSGRHQGPSGQAHVILHLAELFELHALGASTFLVGRAPDLGAICTGMVAI
jgi:hypothetical protein